MLEMYWTPSAAFLRLVHTDPSSSSEGYTCTDPLRNNVTDLVMYIDLESPRSRLSNLLHWRLAWVGRVLSGSDVP